MRACPEGVRAIDPRRDGRGGERHGDLVDAGLAGAGGAAGGRVGGQADGDAPEPVAAAEGHGADVGALLVEQDAVGARVVALAEDGGAHEDREHVGVAADAAEVEAAHVRVRLRAHLREDDDVRVAHAGEARPPREPRPPQPPRLLQRPPDVPPVEARRRHRRLVRVVAVDEVRDLVVRVPVVVGVDLLVRRRRRLRPDTHGRVVSLFPGANGAVGFPGRRPTRRVGGIAHESFAVLILLVRRRGVG